MYLLTYFSFAIPRPDKSAETAIHAHLQHTYVTFGGSLLLAMDSCRECENKLFKK